MSGRSRVSATAPPCDSCDIPRNTARCTDETTPLFAIYEIDSVSGHSAAPAHLLCLGDTLIDMVDPAVHHRFRELAGGGLLARAGVVAIRLIGCQTVVARARQRTMRGLADIVGLPVFGTTKLLVSGHICATGFDPAFDHILAVARPMRSRAA